MVATAEQIGRQCRIELAAEVACVGGGAHVLSHRKLLNKRVGEKRERKVGNVDGQLEDQ